MWYEENKEQAKAASRAYYSANKEKVAAASRAWQLANKEKSRAYRKVRYEKNKEHVKATAKAWRLANKEKVAAASKAWYAANKEKVKADWRAWYEANPGKVAEHTVKRRAAKLHRTVSWSNKKLIAQVYKQAKELTIETGEPYHVDHIIPLQGKLVSGLHVETNLQVIPATDNLTKSNKFQP